MTAHLDVIRARAGLARHARVESRNNFPTGTGIASSASAFAALTLAAAAAAGLTLTEPELSALARQGSGSAARSIPGGFVEWAMGEDGKPDTSFAYTIAPPEHWDLRDVIAVVSQKQKSVGSTSGHALARSSPLQAARVATGLLAGRPFGWSKLDAAVMMPTPPLLGPITVDAGVSPISADLVEFWRKRGWWRRPAARRDSGIGLMHLP